METHRIWLLQLVVPAAVTLTGMQGDYFTILWTDRIAPKAFCVGRKKRSAMSAELKGLCVGQTELPSGKCEGLKGATARARRIVGGG